MSNEIKPILVLQAPLLTLSGYGKHSLEIFLSLLRYNKYDVKVVPTRWGSCPPADLPSDIKEKIDACILKESLKEQPEVFIQVSIPNEFQPKGKYNIGVTAGIETTLCRGEWIEGLNRMDMNIVPSRHAKQVFISTTFTKKEENGREVPVKLEKPVEIVFEGTDTDLYKIVNKFSDNLNSTLLEIKETQCFLFVGHWMAGNLGHDRKNVGMMIKTFLETFKNKKDKPALILKTSGATLSIIDRTECLRKIKMIRDSVGGDLPNVYLLHGELSDIEMNELYNHPKVKTFVTFTRGEGFGKPLLEFSLCGKPIIAPNWSGQIDFLNKEYVTLLPVKLEKVDEKAANEWIIKESSWATVNYSMASKALEDIHSNYSKYKEKAEKLRIENKNNFSYDAMDVLLFNTLDRYIPNFPKKVEIILPKFKKKEQ